MTRSKKLKLQGHLLLKQYDPTYIGSSGKIGMAQNGFGVNVGVRF